MTNKKGDGQERNVRLLISRTCNAEVANAPLDSAPPPPPTLDDSEEEELLMARTTRQPRGIGVAVCTSVNKS
jgi:hypothetical protein